LSSRRQGFLRHVEMPAGVRRQGMNLGPPFPGAGIRVTRDKADAIRYLRPAARATAGTRVRAAPARA
jgi:hypothetical protein